MILTGLVLPFLANEPVTTLTDITPHQVWLAVVAVCSISYASYLLLRYVAPPGAGLWVAIIGGLYSSTATTIVLARRAATEPATAWQAQTGEVSPLSLTQVPEPTRSFVVRAATCATRTAGEELASHGMLRCSATQ